MEQKYNISIYVGDKRELLTELNAISVEIKQAVNNIPFARLELSIPGNTRYKLSENREASLCQPGERVWVAVGDAREEVLFHGVITANELSIQRDDAVLKLQLKHELVSLKNVIQSQVYSDMTDAQIINHLCQQSIETLKNNVTMNIRYEQKVQFRCTDWQMLCSCLDANGAWLIAGPDDIQIVRPQLAVTADADHHFQAKEGLRLDKAKEGLRLDKANWTFTVTEQPKELKVSSWNIDEQKLVSMRATPQHLGNGALDTRGGKVLNPGTWTMDYSTPQPANEVGKWADSLMLNLQLNRAQGEFELDGSAGYRPGQTLAVSDFGPSFDGSGLITSVGHIITPSRWKTQVRVGQQGLTPAMAPLPTIGGLHTGTVADYGPNDPKNHYRIRVHVNALSQEQAKNQLWARFSMPYASKESGLYCYPEPGDEVVIGFFEDNPCYPVILGAIHNPKNKPAILPEGANNLKGWQIKQGGASLKFQLDTKEQTVSFSSGTKGVITLDEQKGINIEGQDGVKIKGSKIDLTN